MEYSKEELVSIYNLLKTNEPINIALVGELLNKAPKQRQEILVQLYIAQLYSWNWGRTKEDHRIRKWTRQLYLHQHLAWEIWELKQRSRDLLLYLCSPEAVASIVEYTQQRKVLSLANFSYRNRYEEQPSKWTAQLLNMQKITGVKANVWAEVNSGLLGVSHEHYFLQHGTLEEQKKILVKRLREDDTVLDLSDMGLSLVPRGIYAFPQLEELILNKNSIKTIPYSLLRLKNLFKVDAFCNPIKKIARGVEAQIEVRRGDKIPSRGFRPFKGLFS